ncbi:MAG: ABC transporter substrate-binding protein [Alphaproteobacteria bacterium]|nr:ABC transporter substrate-binding protein [Alphaproteobacteria bacterium]
MRIEFGRRGLLAGASGGLMLSSLPVAMAQQQQELIVNGYGGSWEKFWREGLLPEFEKMSGIKTKYDSGLARTWTANLRAAGVDKPPYAFIMMNEIFASQLRGEGFFEPWSEAKVPNLKDVHPDAKLKDNNGVYGMISPIGLGYRTDMIKKAPTSWKDLWDNPEFKGKIGMYQIQNTAGYMFLMMAAKMFGKGPLDFDAGFREIQKLKPFPQIDFSGTMGQLLTRGEIAIGILDVPEILRLKNAGAPVEFAAPTEGMFMFEQCFNLLKNGGQKDAASSYFNFVLSEPIQRRSVEEFFVTPVNTKVAIPDALKGKLTIGANDINKILQWDWAAANAQRDVVTERWNRLMR